MTHAYNPSSLKAETGRSQIPAALVKEEGNRKGDGMRGKRELENEKEEFEEEVEKGVGREEGRKGETTLFYMLSWQF